MAVREAYVSARGGGGVGQPSYNPNTFDRTALAALSGLVKGVSEPSPKEKMMAELLPSLLNYNAAYPTAQGQKPSFNVGGTGYTMNPNARMDNLVAKTLPSLAQLGAWRPSNEELDSAGIPGTVDYSSIDSLKQMQSLQAYAKYVSDMAKAKGINLTPEEQMMEAWKLMNTPGAQSLIDSGATVRVTPGKPVSVTMNEMTMSDMFTKMAKERGIFKDMQPEQKQYRMPEKATAPERPKIKMPSESDIQYTMKKRGMTRDQVLKALGL